MLAMQQLAEFKTLYPEINIPVFEVLLSGIGKDTLMRVTTDDVLFFLARYVYLLIVYHFR